MWVNTLERQVLHCPMALALLPHKAFRNSLSHFSPQSHAAKTCGGKNVPSHDVIAPRSALMQRSRNFAQWDTLPLGQHVQNGS